jgi:hypothetical protein
MDFLKSHFFPSYNPAKSLPIASGPHGFISIIDSDLYPVEADELQKKFILALTSPLPATALSNLVKRYLKNYPHLSDYGQTIFCLSFSSRDRATAPGRYEHFYL